MSGLVQVKLFLVVDIDNLLIHVCVICRIFDIHGAFFKVFFPKMLEVDLLLGKSITDLSLHYILQVTISLIILVSEIAVKFIYIFHSVLSCKDIQLLRPNLKICWFAVTRTGLQETCRSKTLFDAHSRKKIF